jgi:hypothetical protein
VAFSRSIAVRRTRRRLPQTCLFADGRSDLVQEKKELPLSKILAGVTDY